MSISIRVIVEDSQRNPAAFSYISLSTSAGEVARVSCDPSKRDSYLFNIERIKRTVSVVTLTVVDLEQKTYTKQVEVRDQTVRFVINAPTPPSPETSPGKQRARSGTGIYLAAFFVTLLIAVAMGYFVVTHWQQVQASGLGGQTYFLISAVLGIAIAFALFGLLRSTARVKGHWVGLAINASGPFAGLLTFLLFAIVLPNKYAAPPALTDVIFEVRGPDNVNSLLSTVKVLASIGTRAETLNFAANTGRAIMAGVSRLDLEREGVSVEVESDKYEDSNQSDMYKPAVTDPIIIHIKLRLKPASSKGALPSPPPPRNPKNGTSAPSKSAPGPLVADAADAHQPDSYYAAKFAEDKTDESLLSNDGQNAFARRDYAWAVKFLEQAKSIQTSGVWQSSYPFLYGAQLALGHLDEAEQSRHDMIEAVTVAVNNRHGYLSRAAPIGFVVRNLGLVRIAIEDAERRRTIDQLIEQMTALKQRAN